MKYEKILMMNIITSVKGMLSIEQWMKATKREKNIIRIEVLGKEMGLT